MRNCHTKDIPCEEINTKDIENAIRRYSQLIPILIVIIIVVAIAFIKVTVSISAWFTLGLLTLIPLIWITFYLYDQRRKNRYVLQIREDWGKSEIAKKRDIKTIRPLFDNIYSRDKSNDYIDDQTWEDLNMDQLYATIDRTHTDPGEAVLYNMLRSPLFDKKELARRSREISFFQKNQKVREDIQLAFVRLGHQSDHNNVFSLLWGDGFSKSRLKSLFTILALVALASIILPFVFSSLVLIAVPVTLFIINLLIHYGIKERIDLETISFPYLLNCIKTAKNISSLNNVEISRYTNLLSELYKSSSGILRKSRFMFPARPDSGDLASVLFEYLNIFFLLEVRAFYAVTDEMTSHIHDLRKLYLTIGELDALQSIASYRTSLSSYSEPEFGTEGVSLEIEEARQPLLENPVPASISFDKNVTIITGSNMGGKSTFLRNIGCNVLLAQTISTTVASYYRGSFFRIITSISRTDDLIAGKSFYYIEAERILKAIQDFNERITTLCIIDELLSGTNSTERINASEAIIRYLTTQNALAIIATHDMELASRLDGNCDFYHFTDNVDENGLKFDYLLKPGIATTQNAITLLKYLGYPKAITEKASEEYQ